MVSWLKVVTFLKVSQNRFDKYREARAKLSQFYSFLLGIRQEIDEIHADQRKLQEVTRYTLLFFIQSPLNQNRLFKL